MRVDAKIVSSIARGGSSAACESYAIQFAIDFNDAEKATLAKALRQGGRPAAPSNLPNFAWADCILKDSSPSEFASLVAAQGALVDFMAAVADVFVAAQEQKATTSLSGS